MAELPKMTISLTIEGEPIPQQRPVVTRNCTFNPQAEAKKRTSWKMRVMTMEQLEGMTLEEKMKADVEYIVKMVFTFVPPKSYTNKKTHTVLEQGFHNIKPDLDNLIKFYLDCGNGVLWSDDSKISYIESKKLYGLEAKTTITVISRGKYGAK